MGERPDDTVLLVDHDSSLLETLRKGLSSLLPDVAIYAARDLTEATSQLGARPMGLVITDLLLPTGGGFELLSYLARSQDRVPAIVIGRGMSPEVRQRVTDLGGLWCFEKPVPLQRLAEAAGSLLAASPRSVVHGVTVAGLLQLLESERKTCTVAVANHRGVGRLFLSRGQLVDAEWQLQRGVEAAQVLVNVKEPRLEVIDVLATSERTIDIPLAHILLDAYRLSDESAQGIEVAESREEIDLVVCEKQLAAFEGLAGFVAAAVCSRNGILAKTGQADVVDRELCAIVDGANRWIDSFLAARDVGSIVESDQMTDEGWLMVWRVVPRDRSRALVAVFRKPTNIGLLRLRLREIAAGMA